MLKTLEHAKGLLFDEEEKEGEAPQARFAAPLRRRFAEAGTGRIAGG